MENKNFLGPACKDFEEDLVLYYYGECRETDSQMIAKHLEECAVCSRFLEGLSQFLPLTEKPNDYPDAFWNRYYTEMQEKLEAVERKNSWWRPFSFFHSWAVPAFSAAVVLVIALSLTFGRGAWHFAGPPAREELPQEIRVVDGNIEFFEAMDFLESIDLLEALDERSRGRNTNTQWHDHEASA